MRKEPGFKDRRILDAFDYIDPRYIAEAAHRIKDRPIGNAVSDAKTGRKAALRQILKLVACLLILSMAIPAVTYVLKHYTDLGSLFGDNTTETAPELTTPETPPPETTAEVTAEPETTAEETTEAETTAEETTAEETTAEETTAEATVEETTAPPEPEYDGSRGLEYKIDGDHAVLVGIGTCTDKDIVTATTYDGLPVTAIDDFAFENVGGFTSVTVSEGVTSIGLHAFANCPDLRGIYLPSTLNNIYGGEGIAFFGCDGVETISVAKNNPKYHSVGNCLIEKDTKILVFGCKNSNIPSDGSVEKIGYYAFSGIGSIKEIVIPEGITEIWKSAFSMCDNLEKVTLPESLTDIGWWAFESCLSLESIEMGSHVTYVGAGAFRGCSKLKTVILPEKLDYLGEETFEGCAIESIVIPEGIKILYGGMFANCRNLKNVRLPEGLEIIGSYAFSQCSALESIVIPDSVTKIEDHVFAYCSKLKNVVLPKSLTLIGSSAFAQCMSLESISVPASVTEFGSEAFRGCKALAEFDFNGSASVWNSVKKGSNWRTESGIELIKCSDREVDAGYTQPDYSELSSIPEVYRNIIENKTSFFDCASGQEIYLDDVVFYFSTRVEKIIESDYVSYSVLDMNGDGDSELVITNLFDVLVFNDEDGTVYCYTLRYNNGWVREIAVDGTFEWHPKEYPYTNNYVIGKLQFNGKTCTIVEVYRKTNVGSVMEPNYEYYVNKQQVTHGEASKFLDTLAIDLVCEYMIDRYPLETSLP